MYTHLPYYLLVMLLGLFSMKVLSIRKPSFVKKKIIKLKLLQLLRFFFQKQVVSTTKAFMRELTVIDSAWLTELALSIIVFYLQFFF